MKRCTNNALKKAADVADAMRRLGNYAGMDDLYRRGCLRHIEDVAYARILLEKHKQSVDEIAADLGASYEGPRARVHRCDRVYPPS